MGPRERRAEGEEDVRLICWLAGLAALYLAVATIAACILSGRISRELEDAHIEGE